MKYITYVLFFTAVYFAWREVVYQRQKYILQFSMRRYD